MCPDSPGIRTERTQSITPCANEGCFSGTKTSRNTTLTYVLALARTLAMMALRAVVLVLLFSLLSCSVQGDATFSSASTTPAGTTAAVSSPHKPTPSAMASSAATTAPQAAPMPGVATSPIPLRSPELPPQPLLPAGATRIASGSLTVPVVGGASQEFEAHRLVAGAPPSASLVWSIAWRSTDTLTASWYRQIAAVELGRGQWGTAELGGAGFRLSNDGTTPVYVEFSYLIGSR